MTKDEALKLALEALEEAADAIDSWGSYASGYFQVKHDLEGDISKAKSAITTIKEALSSCQCPECKVVLHASDCAVHNEPAYPKGECNCGAQPSVSVEQEPDYYGLTADHLWMSISKDHYDRLKPEYRMTCYTTPPQRKPLTDEEKQAMWARTKVYLTPKRSYFQGIVDSEAAHGIKGGA